MIRSGSPPYPCSPPTAPRQHRVRFPDVRQFRSRSPKPIVEEWRPRERRRSRSDQRRSSPTIYSNSSWQRTRFLPNSRRSSSKNMDEFYPLGNYRCSLCLIDVPSKETLDKHIRGKDHIKREKQIQEQRKDKVNINDVGGYGFKTGPNEIIKLSHTEREELEQHRKTIKSLQAEVQENNLLLAQCKKEHGVVDMQRKIHWCQDNHMCSKAVIFCKYSDLGSTPKGIKKETIVKTDFVHGVFETGNEYIEFP